MEVWKDIYFEENGVEWDYRGLYQVSNKGRVKSLSKILWNGHGYFKSKEKILKLKKGKDGYLKIGLCINSKIKFFQVHRLVAFMFIKNNDLKEKTEINHKDENKLNNCIENLEWVTAKENSNYGTRNKRISESSKGKSRNKGSLIERWSLDDELIDIKYQFEYVEMGFYSSAISMVCKGKRKSTGGYIFRYHKEEE